MQKVFFLTLRDIFSLHASSLCYSLLSLQKSSYPLLYLHPLPPPPLPTPTLLSSALITQLLLGNVVPAGPGISRVATATQRTHADTVNMLVFQEARATRTIKPTCVFSSGCYSIRQRGTTPRLIKAEVTASVIPYAPATSLHLFFTVEIEEKKERSGVMWWIADSVR